MVKTTIVGFPRIGEFRELKFATEAFFRGDSTTKDLLQKGKELRKKHWQLLKDSGIDEITSNDFSFYDTTLDTACLFNIVPAAVRSLALTPLEEYFALARGYQGEKGDVKARPMKKWFNTNYHYLTPKIEASTNVRVVGTKIFDEYQEAKSLGIETRPVILGPFTFLQLAEIDDDVNQEKLIIQLTVAYQEVFSKLDNLGAKWIQLDEPGLVKDLSTEQVNVFETLYQNLLVDKPLNVLIQTYFGDVRDVYHSLITLPVDAIGLDFVEGKQTKALLTSGFPEDKILYAGVVNGKNIWRNQFEQTLLQVKDFQNKKLVLSTSCSLLHVPYTTDNESFSPEIVNYFSFAKEKLEELKVLASLVEHKEMHLLQQNKALFAAKRFDENSELKEKLEQLTAKDFERSPDFEQRRLIQKNVFQLPDLPTTTIGSFPQTKEVKQNRSKWKKGEIDQQHYEQFIEKQIKEWLEWQESIDLDVLVHGEFERNDMVEYFGQQLDGYLFSKNGWVQSYGTRGVKPPIIWSDITRKAPITVKWSAFAQSQTKKVVKGMLTGPVTILNWSFPREDVSTKESTLQLALAIQEEVLDLEKNGIRMIQIDEAALREKLPLRQSDWYSEYLDWAIPAFRLIHSKVKPETQIHTHMCYSEFTDILSAIDQMDADVISFEASRSNLAILDELVRRHFKTAVGPGVYDIHSPRIPSVEELTTTIHEIIKKVPREKIWINPDCGLKTRGIVETKASLANMTKAVAAIREE
ncbi:5-methyltetrahydropteroyltriglutamate--homocysteine S-methyltransferase [Enterococcus italicus]|uniref:5-methyltetrahydropteroyltriglutamate-- homocysteine S-methyltransferase n=1 Tax=Enterococcus italicus TaxID=246144 RepID=UPI002074AA0F|nr:5-methyltetrahydropteroyltriglutamate--homocysteine S-methyltransferase [Enterococcus italicus]MCM6882031.1 5-methyltetrahydropteroyltriglutamate--homocysteine S-methyltransferase [Enterococcus italicus]